MILELWPGKTLNTQSLMTRCGNLEDNSERKAVSGGLACECQREIESLSTTLSGPLI